MNKALPIKPGMLDRRQVRETLSQGMDYPLIVVSAGPGYGKTQAVARFAAEIEHRVAWLNLSPLDNDTDHFWNSMISALRPELAVLAEKLRKIDFPRTLKEFDDYISIVADALGMSTETILVIDNYSLIEAKPIRTFIERMIQMQLAKLCVILIINKREDEHLGPILFGRDHWEIGADSLCFSGEEVRRLFELHGCPIDDADLTKLMAATEGWPLPVYLMCRDYARKGANQTLFVGPLAEINRLFKNGFFQEYDQKLQNMLISFALLPSFSAEMIRHLAPEQLSEYLTLITNNIFIYYDYNNKLFTMHKMYQDFLRNQEFILNKNHFKYVYRIAADWFLKNDLILEAIECYFHCGDFEKIVGLGLALPMSRRDTTTTDFILNYLKKIPEDFIASNPQMVFGVAFMLLNRMEINRGSALLESLRTRLENNADNEADRLLLSEVYGLLGDVNLLKNGTEFVDYFKMAEDNLDHGQFLQTKLMIPAQNNYILFIPGTDEGRLDDIIKKVNTAARHTERIFGKLGYGYELMFSAEAAYARADLESMKEYCRRAIYLAHDKGLDDIVCDANFLLMSAALCEGDYEAIKRHLSALLKQAANQPSGGLEELSDFAKGWLYLRLGLPDQVPRWIAEYDHMRYTLQPLTSDRNKIIHAQYLIEKHLYRDCLAILDQMAWVFKEKGAWLTRLHGFILKAICWNNLGLNEMAVDCLHQAYEMTFKNNVVMYFIEHGNRVRSLINLALKQHQYPFDQAWLMKINLKAAEYMEKIITVRDIYKGTQAPHREIRLSKREKEVLRLIAHGLTRNEISKQLGISVNSVKTYTAGTYNKLGAVNKADAIRLALNLGVYSEGDHSKLN